jgi:hypothetical protein
MGGQFFRISFVSTREPPSHGIPSIYQRRAGNIQLLFIVEEHPTDEGHLIPTLLSLAEGSRREP